MDIGIISIYCLLFFFLCIGLGILCTGRRATLAPEHAELLAGSTISTTGYIRLSEYQ